MDVWKTFSFLLLVKLVEFLKDIKRKNMLCLMLQCLQFHLLIVKQSFIEVQYLYLILLAKRIYYFMLNVLVIFLVRTLYFIFNSYIIKDFLS